MVRDGYLINPKPVFTTDKECSKTVSAVWEVVVFSSLEGGKSQRHETWLRYVWTLDNLEPSFLSWEATILSTSVTITR